MSCQLSKPESSTPASEALAAVETRPLSKRQLAIMGSKEADHARFWRHVSKEPHEKGCWVWTSTKTDRGYGTFPFTGVKVRAHRLSYFIANGTLTEELLICHSCDNPSCVNPAHLFQGTHQDNRTDCHIKRRNPRDHRTHCIRGHEFTPENTTIEMKDGTPRRRCVKCRSYAMRIEIKESNRREKK